MYPPSFPSTELALLCYVSYILLCASTLLCRFYICFFSCTVDLLLLTKKKIKNKTNEYIQDLKPGLESAKLVQQPTDILLMQQVVKYVVGCKF